MNDKPPQDGQAALTTKTPENLTQRVENFAQEIGEDVHVAWSAFEAWVRRELEIDKAQKAEIAAKEETLMQQTTKGDPEGEEQSITNADTQPAEGSQDAAAGTGAEVPESEPVNSAGVQAEAEKVG